jgi:acylphosphatase
MASDVIRTRVIVHGAVQGVFFRDTCRRVAEQAGVSGWVRNLADGSVEAVFEGEPDAVHQMVEWCRSGPPLANVEKVEEHTEAPERPRKFKIRR